DRGEARLEPPGDSLRRSQRAPATADRRYFHSVNAHRTGLLMAAGGSVAAALALAATSGAADKPAPTGGAPAFRSGPVASLRPAHRRVVAGKRLLLDASPSADVTGRIVDYRWDLNGDGVFEK